MARRIQGCSAKARPAETTDARPDARPPPPTSSWRPPGSAASVPLAADAREAGWGDVFTSRQVGARWWLGVCPRDAPPTRQLSPEPAVLFLRSPLIIRCRFGSGSPRVVWEGPVWGREYVGEQVLLGRWGPNLGLGGHGHQQARSLAL